MTWDYGYAVFSYDVNGTPYSVKNYDAILDVERTYLYVTNLQGDVLSVVDSVTGQTAVSYVYDAWGKLISKSGTSSDYASIYEYNPLTYRGYIYDSETGFYYLQSRYYDPTVGRFLNADDTYYLGTNSQLLSWDLLSYCVNNPVDCVDYFGHEALKYDFWFITDNEGKKWYGGYQSWWGDKDTFRWLFISVKKSEVGCGPTAAANIIAYLKLHHLSRLTNRSVDTKDGFVGLMNDVFNYVKPSVFGLWWLSDFTSGVENYAKSKGVSLKGVWSKKSVTYNNAINYIKEGLKKDCPVALIIHYNSRLKGYEKHWMVITKIKDTFSHGRRSVIITVSTWGKERELNFYDVFNYSSYWGIMYFTW